MFHIIFKKSVECVDDGEVLVCITREIEIGHVITTQDISGEHGKLLLSLFSCFVCKQFIYSICVSFLNVQFKCLVIFLLFSLIRSNIITLLTTPGLFVLQLRIEKFNQ